MRRSFWIWIGLAAIGIGCGREGVNNWTPLMHAVHKNQAGTARVLIEGGAEVDARGPHDETALMMAAGYGQEEMVRLLLKAGADPSRKEVHGTAALDMAVMGVIDIDGITVGRCQTGTVKALLDHAPGLSVNEHAWGNMGRMVKRLAGCEEVVRLVEERRASR